MKKRNVVFLIILFIILPLLGAIIGFFMASRPKEMATASAPRTTARETNGWAVGKAPAEGTVTFRNGTTEVTVPTKNGKFQAELPPGDYTVTESSAGGTASMGNVSIASGEPSLVESLPSTAAATGTTSTAMSTRRETRRAAPNRGPASVGPIIVETAPPSPTLAPPPVFVLPPPIVAEAPPPPAPPVVAPVPATTVTLVEDKTREQKKCDKETPREPCPVEVFYGTDRNSLTNPSKRHSEFRTLAFYYGGDRDTDDPAEPVKYGTCIVTIPPVHEKFTGVLEHHGVYDAENAVFLKEVHELKQGDFLDKLNERVNRDGDMIVFIHGFNVSFADAARRTAQIYYDLGLKAVPVFFSWPSGGHIWDYWADEASIDWSSPHLRDFLEMLARNTHAKRIHLIAHSMGNRAMTRALAEIGRQNHSMPACHDSCPQMNPLIRFNQIVLAAPDLDTDVFLELKKAMQMAICNDGDPGCASPGGVTLYASRHDRAVLVSWIIHRFRRLGFAKANPTRVDGVDEIDATAASTDFLGHSYYGESVLWDIKLLFQQTAIAKRAGCTVTPPKQDPGYYVFNNLCKERQPKPNVFVRLWHGLRGQHAEPELINPSCTQPTLAPAAGTGL